ncbi:MAG TPA: amino acid ABC transporter permease, partial [Afipia sp.]|nr:amino acid ABC transporter permease [Afipia sp.]
WRVNLPFALGALLPLPLLIPRAPAKALNSGLFFAAYPVIGFFLLHGGGLKGFAIHWLADLGAGLAF